MHRERRENDSDPPVGRLTRKYHDVLYTGVGVREKSFRAPKTRGKGN